jgi:subtilisin family serine protease
MMSKFAREVHSGGVVLTLTSDEVYVEFKQGLPLEEIVAFIREHKLSLVKEEPSFLPAPDFNEVFPDRRWLHLPDGEPIEEFLERLLDDERVRLASPVYHRADLLPKKTGLTLSDFLLVRFQPQAPDEEIAALIQELDVEDVTGKPNLLGEHLRRLRIRNAKRRNVLEVAELFARSPLVKDAGPDWSQLNSAISATVPNDALYPNQWNMNNVGQSPDGGTVGEDIGAQDGWDLSTGAATMVIAILDTGCDLNHEDLSAKYVPVADRRDVVAATNTPEDDHGHGTCCAGIAGAESNNNQGVAGVAWNCRIMPIRMMQTGSIQFESWILEALNWARTHGAHVISMSWWWWGPHANVDAAITAAHAANIVLVAAAGNFAPQEPPNAIDHPASHPLVMAVGASDEFGQRCVWNSKSASQFGPDLDVMAPGINTWTTDRSGSGVGYNNAGIPHVPPYGDTAGNYFSHFGGTSGATPHVAGLAGLLRSLYPALTNDEVRSIIEKTAEKVGGYTYAEDPAHPSGTWNNEMGYGRINVFRALDFADAYIKDNPADTGSVPFAGNFWGDSDIVVRQNDDNIFSYESAKQGQKNYIYVRVSNLGPATARNLVVSLRAVPFVSTEFICPSDWTAVDASHIQPTDVLTSFASLPAGGTVDAKFRLSKAQVDVLYGWKTTGWHPCLLAAVECDNDYGGSVGVRTWLSNNLAQRNISIVPSQSGSSISYPFIAGHNLNRDLYMELVITRRGLPREIELLLDAWDVRRYFPAVDLPALPVRQTITFLDRARLALSWCGRDEVLTLEAGSSFECRTPAKHDISLRGAALVERQGQPWIAIREDVAIVGLQKRPGETRQISLTFRVPEGAAAGDQYRIDVSQRNPRQEVVGGATLIAEVTGSKRPELA